MALRIPFMIFIRLVEYSKEIILSSVRARELLVILKKVGKTGDR